MKNKPSSWDNLKSIAKVYGIDLDQELENRYQQGKNEAILHQCNHDVAVQEAYEQGRTRAIDEIRTFSQDNRIMLDKYGHMLYCFDLELKLKHMEKEQKNEMSNM